MNSIFNSSNSKTPQVDNNMLQQFNQFKNSFKGDPRQAVMNMLKNGQINNDQLQQAIQFAKQFKGLLK